MIQPHRIIAVSLAAALTLAATNSMAGQGAISGRGGLGGGANRSQSPPLPAGNGLIEGIVQSGDTMRPLDQVSITLMMAGPNGGRSGSSTVITDTSGHFSFPDVAMAPYSILAQRDGYFGLSEIGVVRPNTSKSRVLSASQPHVGLPIVLNATSAPSGISVPLIRNLQ